MRRLGRWLTVVRLVHLRELRRHPLRTAVAVVSVGAGVSMILSIVVVVGSTIESFEQQAVALSGPAPLRVVGATSAGGVLPGDIETIRETEGVAAVAPLVRGVVQFERPTEGGVDLFGDVVVLGVDCATATRFGVPCDALTAGQVGTPALADPPAGVVRTETGAVPLDVTTVVPDLEAVGPRVVVLSIERAQEWFARGGVDVAYVLPNPDTPVPVVEDRVDVALADGLLVLGARERPPEVDQVLATIIPLFGLIGILALAVGMILVANTLALSLEERRQQLAVVAALGGTPGQVVHGALVQAAIIGFAGGALGTGGAFVLAHPLTASVSDFTLSISGIRVEVVRSLSPLVPGVVLGTVVAVVAAWRPSRRAQRSDVAAELSNRDRRADARPQGLAAKALLAFAIGLVGAGLAAAGGADGSLRPWQPAAGFLGLLLGIAAFSIAMGRITALAVTASLARWSPRNATIRLAVANLAREPARTGVMGLAIGSAVAMALVVAGFSEQAEAGIAEGTASTFDGALAVSVGPADGGEQVFRGVPAPVVDAIRSHGGVARADRGAYSFANDGAGAIAVFGTEAEIPEGPRVYEGSVDSARFADGEVMIGAALARAQGVGAGDLVTIPVHDGSVELPVMGVWADGNAVGNSVTTTYRRVVELYGSASVDNLLVTPTEGVPTDDLARTLRAASLDPALRVEQAEQVAERITDQIEPQLAPFWALQRGLTVVAFIAVLSTMVLVGVQRTRELGLLAAVGMAPRSIGLMVLAEAAVVGAFASVIGAGLGALMSMALAAVIPLILGWENPIRLALGVVPGYALLTVALAVAGAALPAWRAARVRVVEALAYE